MTRHDSLFKGYSLLGGSHIGNPLSREHMTHFLRGTHSYGGVSYRQSFIKGTHEGVLTLRGYQGYTQLSL